LELFCGTAQHIAADRVELPVAVEEADHALGLLKRLDQPVEQDPVKSAVSETDAILVVLQKAFIPGSPGPKPAAYLRLSGLYAPTREGYQGRSPWLVSSLSCRTRPTEVRRSNLNTNDAPQRAIIPSQAETSRA
jgi:hypothetical protein